MATNIFFIVVLFFSIRGFFLAFPSVVARLSGFILGYIIAYSYRAPVALLIADNSNTELTPMILQTISGAALFFGTLFITGRLVTGAFKLISEILPLSKGLFDGKSTSSRIFGAVFNAAIGASFVLIGLWGYDSMIDDNEPPDTLQQVANTFGESVLSLATYMSGGEKINWEKTSYISTSKTTKYLTKTTSGTAEIISNRFSGKHITLTTENSLIEKSPPDNTIDIQQLLNNEQVQNLLNDPAIREQLIEQLQNNPEKFMEALNNPKFKQLLKQFN